MDEMESEITIGGQIFPTECPKNCPEKKTAFYQGCYCSRCPIFSCVDRGGGFVLLEPEEYREDWAKNWKEWFDNSMVGRPGLPLWQKEGEECKVTESKKPRRF